MVDRIDRTGKRLQVLLHQRKQNQEEDEARGASCDPDTPIGGAAVDALVRSAPAAGNFKHRDVEHFVAEVSDDEVDIKLKERKTAKKSKKNKRPD